MGTSSVNLGFAPAAFARTSGTRAASTQAAPGDAPAFHAFVDLAAGRDATEEEPGGIGWAGVAVPTGDVDDVAAVTAESSVPADEREDEVVAPSVVTPDLRPILVRGRTAAGGAKSGGGGDADYAAAADGRASIVPAGFDESTDRRVHRAAAHARAGETNNRTAGDGLDAYTAADEDASVARSAAGIARSTDPVSSPGRATTNSAVATTDWAPTTSNTTSIFSEVAGGNADPASGATAARGGEAVSPNAGAAVRNGDDSVVTDDHMPVEESEPAPRQTRPATTDRVVPDLRVAGTPVTAAISRPSEPGEDDALTPTPRMAPAGNTEQTPASHAGPATLPGTHSNAPAVVSAAAAESAAPALHDLPDDVAAQIVKAIRLQTIQGGGEAQIQLNPEHFGEVRIAIRVDQGVVIARIQAESAAVRDWLQTNQAALRDGLAEQSLTLAKLDVATPSSESESPGRRDERDTPQHTPQEQRRRSPARAERFEPFEVVV